MPAEKPNNQHGIPNKIYSSWIRKAQEAYKKSGNLTGAAQHTYKGVTYVLRSKGKKPDGSPRFAATPKEAKVKSQATRESAIKAQDIEYLKTLSEMGYSADEAAAMLAGSKEKVTALETQIKGLNKDKGSMRFSLGHETAVEQGGGDFGRNVRLERGKGSRGNFARSSKAEIDPSVKPVLGIPSSGREAAIMDVSKEFDLPLTPKDRQAIKANPVAANDIITQRFQQLESFAKQGVLKFTNGVARFIRQTTGALSTPEDLEIAPRSEQLGFKPIDMF